MRTSPQAVGSEEEQPRRNSMEEALELLRSAKSRCLEGFASNSREPCSDLMLSPCLQWGLGRRSTHLQASLPHMYGHVPKLD